MANYIYKIYIFIHHKLSKNGMKLPKKKDIKKGLGDGYQV